MRTPTYKAIFQEVTMNPPSMGGNHEVHVGRGVAFSNSSKEAVGAAMSKARGNFTPILFGGALYKNNRLIKEFEDGLV